MSERDPGETTVQVEHFKRKLHEQIGEWLANHWTELVAAAGGAFVGAAAVYGAFTSQVHDALQASADAKQAATQLTATVGELRGTVNQLVTQKELQAALERVTRLEEDYAVAHQHAGDAPVPRRRKPDGR